MKLIKSIILLALFTVLSVAHGTAQQGIIQFGNGTTIFVNTKVTPSGSGPSLGNIYSSNSGDTVHRILTDSVNKIYFGYDLKLRRDDTTGNFYVSIMPLSKTPDEIMRRISISNSNSRSATAVGRNQRRSTFTDYAATSLPNYPENLVLEDGDVLELNLLENKTTGSVISDQIKIVFRPTSKGFSFSNSNSTSSTKPRDFSLGDVRLKLVTPKIFIDNKEFATNSSVAGAINWVYIKNVGRFIFSFKPQPAFNFRKTGVIEGNVLHFEMNGSKYRFESEAPILEAGGKWNLWVMFDGDYQPASAVPDRNPFIFGAASKVEYVFER